MHFSYANKMECIIRHTYDKKDVRWYTRKTKGEHGWLKLVGVDLNPEEMW